MNKIDSKFGINYNNGLYYFDNIKSIKNLPQRVYKSLIEIKPNNIFAIDGKADIHHPSKLKLI